MESFRNDVESLRQACSEEGGFGGQTALRDQKFLHIVRVLRTIRKNNPPPP